LTTTNQAKRGTVRARDRRAALEFVRIRAIRARIAVRF
jgi:hypothetical protein